MQDWDSGVAAGCSTRPLLSVLSTLVRSPFRPERRRVVDFASGLLLKKEQLGEYLCAWAIETAECVAPRLSSRGTGSQSDQFS